MRETRYTIIIAVIFTAFFSCVNSAQAAVPVLNFSDLTSGPKTGLGDGSGEGVIVTIWGNNLGSTQGTSKVYFKDSTDTSHEATDVYYWKDADGTLPGGPANLYESHRMEEIAFSIPSVVADGAGKIYVTVDGVNSNELDFTVQDGEIFWVDGNSGNDSTGNGSYLNPWATVGWSSGAATKAVVTPGDLIYVKNYLRSGSDVYINAKDGASDQPIAIVTYPGSYARIRNGAWSHWNITDKPFYWIISKWDVQSNSGGVYPFGGGRVVGNKITDYPDGAGCADGSAGAISAAGGQGGVRIFGNEVSDYGCVTTSNQHHTYYFSVRDWGSDIEGMEIGWNYLHDNWARGGIHFYDEHGCFGYSSPVTIHHNLVQDQVGPAFNIGAWSCDPGYTLPGDFDVYSNLFINPGQLADTSDVPYAIAIAGDDVTGHFRIWNNTIYGYGYSGMPAHGWNDIPIYVPGDPYPTTSRWLAGSWEFANNIIVDTNNIPLAPTNGGNKPPITAGGNIWYDPDGIYGPPSWDNNPITLDPLFVNPEGNDFSFQAGSPALGSGIDYFDLDHDGLTNDPINIGSIGFNFSSDATPPSAPQGLNVL